MEVVNFLIQFSVLVATSARGVLMKQWIEWQVHPLHSQALCPIIPTYFDIHDQIEKIQQLGFVLGQWLGKIMRYL